MNIGFTRSAYWLILSVTETINEDSLVLQVGDQHINQLDFYQVQNEKPQLQYQSGDYFPFDQRPLPAVGFYFPINRSGTYLVRVDKHHESLQLYFGVKTILNVLDQEKTDTAFMALCSGMILLLLIFGLYLLIISWDVLYLNYLLYVFSAWLFVMAQTGFGFQYLWPGDPWFASKARPVFSMLTIVLSIRFMELFIGGIRNKGARRALDYSTVVALLITLIVLLGPYSSNKSDWWMYFQFCGPIFTILYISLAIYFLIRKSLRGNKLAIFYLVALATIIVMVLFQLVYYTGTWNLTQSFYSRFGITTAIVVEIVIITAGMAYRFNTYRLDKERLMVQMHKQQQENTRILLEVQEAERDQIANQLHDIAGSLLSAARLNLSAVREVGYAGSEEEKTKLLKAEEAVSIVSDTVRNLSHALSPIMLQKAGFKAALEKVISIVNASGKISIELVVVGFDNPIFLSTYYASIYSMVYELLNNIVKHSRAANALVQVIEHEDGFTITTEDDGIGMSAEQMQQLQKQGMAGIISRVKFYNGEIAFDDNNPGLMTTIEIPLRND